ncbi:MAG TPA: Smr/MutS family protein [Alphaproteobacteria bacterium]|jgi:DNA-nicking Smr family endonuclease
MTRRPKPFEREPPWMRLGPAADAPDEGDDGERLWQKLAAGVKPLGETKHKKHARPLPSPLEREVPKRSFGGGGKSEQATGGENPLRPALRAGHLPLKGGGKKEGPPPLVPGQLAGLDRRSGERLRKGQMPVEAELDLHGMTQEAAHAAVLRFVETQHAAGKRCVLIVTGKGGKSAGPFQPKAVPGRLTFGSGRGVLKEALPRWLNEPRLRAHIIAVSPASRAHGGEGAVYVLLKRKR